MNAYSMANQGKKQTKKVADSDSALFIVGSFMNHTTRLELRSARDFFGKMLFVRARRPMRRGEEVLTDYGEGWDKFGEQGMEM